MENLNQGYKEIGKGVNDLVFLKMEKDFRKAEKKKKHFDNYNIWFFLIN